MKKSLIIFLLTILLIPKSVLAVDDLTPNSKSSILIEPTTRNIIYEKNAHERLPMASMTKMMTLLLTFEALDNGQIKLDDKVTISDASASMGGSQMFLQPGMKISVNDIIKGIAVSSGNDASVAIAEFIGGSESAFVDMMNDKVAELGLGNTNFVNSHGLDKENHFSSAYDMAMIALELLNYPEILNYTSIYEETFVKPDGTNVWLVNSNKLVRFMEGVDGLKTGYTSKAGYCLTATGFRHNMRLIAVAMGVPSSDLRSRDISSLLNYGWNGYKINTIIKKNEILEKLIDEKATKEIEIISSTDLATLYKTSDKQNQYTYKIKYDKYKLPLKANDKIGIITIYDKDKVYKELDAVVKYDVNKKSIWDIYKIILKLI